MEYCALMNTTMVTGYQLRKYDGSPEENQTLYMLMIGNLLYVME